MQGGNKVDDFRGSITLIETLGLIRLETLRASSKIQTEKSIQISQEFQKQAWLQANRARSNPSLANDFPPPSSYHLIIDNLIEFRYIAQGMEIYFPERSFLAARQSPAEPGRPSLSGDDQQNVVIQQRASCGIDFVSIRGPKAAVTPPCHSLARFSYHHEKVVSMT